MASPIFIDLTTDCDLQPECKSTPSMVSKNSRQGRTGPESDSTCLNDMGNTTSDQSHSSSTSITKYSAEISTLRRPKPKFQNEHYSLSSDDVGDDTIIASQSPMDTCNSKEDTDVLWPIKFTDGHESLRAFPACLQADLEEYYYHTRTQPVSCARVYAHGGSLLLQCHGRPSKFVVTDTNHELDVARYSYGPRYQLIVVCAREGTFFNQGKPALIVYDGHRKTDRYPGYNARDWSIWKPDSAVIRNSVTRLIRSTQAFREIDLNATSAQNRSYLVPSVRASNTHRNGILPQPNLGAVTGSRACAVTHRDRSKRSLVVSFRLKALTTAMGTIMSASTAAPVSAVSVLSVHSSDLLQSRKNLTNLRKNDEDGLYASSMRKEENEFQVQYLDNNIQSRARSRHDPFDPEFTVLHGSQQDTRASPQVRRMSTSATRSDTNVTSTENSATSSSTPATSNILSARHKASRSYTDTLPETMPRIKAEEDYNRNGRIEFVFKKSYDDDNPRIRSLILCDDAMKLFAQARCAGIARVDDLTLSIRVGNGAAKTIMCDDEDDYATMHAEVMAQAIHGDVEVVVMAETRNQWV